jgi:hypothetical protein
VRNQTHQGTYGFTSPYDGSLAFMHGSVWDRAYIEYDDLSDNGRVNIGDRLALTGLAPQSDYTIKMLWAPTGDQITSASFSTSG